MVGSPSTPWNADQGRLRAWAPDCETVLSFCLLDSKLVLGDNVWMKRPVLTLRFHNTRTHTRLKKVAGLVGVSMNDIAEVAIERELDFLAADLEDELLETVDALRSWRYTDEQLTVDIAAFSEGEAHERDPLQATMAPPNSADAVGVRDIFADTVEH